jgi:hypothetical protein
MPWVDGLMLCCEAHARGLAGAGDDGIWPARSPPAMGIVWLFCPRGPVPKRDSLGDGSYR